MKWCGFCSRKRFSYVLSAPISDSRWCRSAPNGAYKRKKYQWFHRLADICMYSRTPVIPCSGTHRYPGGLLRGALLPADVQVRPIRTVQATFAASLQGAERIRLSLQMSLPVSRCTRLVIPKRTRDVCAVFSSARFLGCRALNNCVPTRRVLDRALPIASGTTFTTRMGGNRRYCPPRWTCSYPGRRMATRRECSPRVQYVPTFVSVMPPIP